MEIPIFSLVSLVTEMFVTVGILTIIYRAYYEGVFMRPLAFFLLGYELMFNISYMLSRVMTHVPEHEESRHSLFEIGTAIFHGVFSLIMFVTLMIFFFIAAKKYADGVNYFKLHPVFTLVFVGSWLVSVFSGVLLFYLLYI